MTDCEAFEAQLPLLRYADELTPEERVGLLDHLEVCASCRRARDEVEAAAASLDVVPLQHPERLQGLKARVLAAVSGGCPREGEVLWRDELGDEEAAELDRHLVQCAPCRESGRAFQAVGDALDLDVLPRPAGLDGLKARVLAETGAGRRGGVVLRFPGWALRAAAAVLVAGGLSFGAWALQGDGPAPEPGRGTVYLAAIKRGADELAYQGDLDDARLSYEMVVAEGRGDPDAGELVAEAERELRVIRLLQDSLRDSPREQRFRSIANIVVTHPDSFAIGTPSRTLEAAAQGKQPATPARLQLDPQRAIVLDVSPDVRRDLYASPAFKQALSIQQGRRFERLGDLARAQEKYEEAIALAPDTPGAERARELLERLRGRAG